MSFINDDFLLTTDAARELYHGYAEKMPIIDYHCHLPPAEIAEDKTWENIAQVWLGARCARTASTSASSRAMPAGMTSS